MEQWITSVQLPVAALALRKKKRRLILNSAQQTNSLALRKLAPVRGCCLRVAHYASVMTTSESHAPLQRKVTLIKPHLMIELIKSATLFPSLRVRLYEHEGGLEQSLCTVNMSLG